MANQTIIHLSIYADKCRPMRVGYGQMRSDTDICGLNTDKCGHIFTHNVV